MSNLSVKITSKKDVVAGKDFFEGTVTVSNRLRATKLQKQDGATRFSTRASLKQTAEKLGSELGLSLEWQEKAAPKKAAKKSSKRASRCDAVENTGSKLDVTGCQSNS